MASVIHCTTVIMEDGVTGQRRISTRGKAGQLGAAHQRGGLP